MGYISGFKGLIQARFDGITAYVLAAIPTELSRLLGWSCAVHVVYYVNDIQRIVVVTVAENSSVMNRGSSVTSMTAVGCMDKE
jgi:hypothetical protein